MTASLSELMVQQSPDAMVATDAKGCVVSWNRAAELTFGFSETEARGSLLADLIVPSELREDELARVCGYLVRIGERDAPFRGEGFDRLAPFELVPPHQVRALLDTGKVHDPFTL